MQKLELSLVITSRPVAQPFSCLGVQLSSCLVHPAVRHRGPASWCSCPAVPAELSTTAVRSAGRPSGGQLVGRPSGPDRQGRRPRRVSPVVCADWRRRRRPDSGAAGHGQPLTPGRWPPLLRPATARPGHVVPRDGRLAQKSGQGCYVRVGTK